MSQPVLVKAYGQLWPATEQDCQRLLDITDLALPAPEEPWAKLNGDLLAISFEGVYFPQHEALNAIQSFLTSQQQGKLDILDLENWKLIRTIFKDGKMETHAAPLNNVLDYSGF